MTLEELIGKNPLAAIPTSTLRKMKASLLYKLGQIELELTEREEFLRGLKRARAMAKVHLN